MRQKHFIALFSLIGGTFLSSPAFASSYDPAGIYTYGSGDFLAQVFNGVAMLSTGGFVFGLIKIALLVALLSFIINVGLSFTQAAPFTPNGGEGFLAMLRTSVLAAFAVYAMLFPKTQVYIIDRVDPTQTQVVGNIPLIPAKIAHIVSTIGDVMGEEFETVFSLPDTLQFRNGGLALGAKYVNSVSSIYPPTSSTADLPASAALISQSLREYIMRCVLPNFGSMDGTSGAKTGAFDVLLTSDDLMSTLKDSPLFRDPNVMITAVNATGVAGCGEAIDSAYAAWVGNMSGWVREIETKMIAASAGSAGIGGLGSPINIGSGLLTGEAVQRYFPNGNDTNKVLMTIALSNLFVDSVQSYLAFSGNPYDISGMLSRKTQTSGWLTAAKFFNSLVHTMRSIFEGIVYGFAVFLAVAVAVAGFRPVFTYVKIAFWLQCWVPFYVVLNLFADIETQRLLDNLFLTAPVGAKGPTMKNISVIAEQSSLTLGYIGSLVWTVPTLAWAMIKGGEYAMTHAAKLISAGGGAQQAAQATGGEIAGKGNVTISTRNFGSDNYMAGSAFTSGAGFLRSSVNALETNQMIQRFGTSMAASGLLANESMQIAKGNRIGDHAVMAGQISGSKIAGEISGFSKFGDPREVAVMSAKVQGMIGAAGAEAREMWAGKLVEGGIAGNETEAFSKIEEFAAAQTPANALALRGDSSFYGSYLENFMKLSVGQQQGMISAARSAGLSLSDYGSVTSFIENMNKVGAIDAYQSGLINESDLRNIGFMHKMAEAGDADAAAIRKHVTGMDAREQAAFLKSREGLNEMAKFEVRGQMAAAMGYGNDMAGFYSYLKQSHGSDTVTLNEGMASYLNAHMKKAGYENFHANAGDEVTFALDSKSGKIGMAHSRGGGESAHYDVDSKQTGWENSEKALRSVQTGYRSDNFNRKTGDIVLSNSQEDQAFIKSFNGEVDKQIAAFTKVNPGVQIDPKYADSLKLKVGDHLNYVSGADGLSSFSIERGGRKAVQYSTHKDFGEKTSVSQGRLEYTGGTEGRGYVTGTIGETLRNMGVSEETARRWEARGSALLGIVRELLPVMSVAGGRGSAVSKPGTTIKADGPYSPLGWKYPE